MRVLFTIKAIAVHPAVIPDNVTVTVIKSLLRVSKRIGWPNRGTTAIPAPFALTAAAMASPNPCGNVLEYLLPSFPITEISEPRTLNSLETAGMDAESESSLADKGASLLHNRIVPSTEPETTFLFSG